MHPSFSLSLAIFSLSPSAIPNPTAYPPSHSPFSPVLIRPPMARSFDSALPDSLAGAPPLPGFAAKIPQFMVDSSRSTTTGPVESPFSSFQRFFHGNFPPLFFRFSHSPLFVDSFKQPRRANFYNFDRSTHPDPTLKPVFFAPGTKSQLWPVCYFWLSLLWTNTPFLLPESGRTEFPFFFIPVHFFAHSLIQFSDSGFLDVVTGGTKTLVFRGGPLTT